MVRRTQITHHQGKVEALTAYFTSLMNQTVSANWNFNLQSLYTGLPTTTTALTAPFTAVEAWAAIKGKDRNSAPGPDGFGPSFYNAIWPTTRAPVMKFLQGFYGCNIDLQRVNRAFMVMIQTQVTRVAG